MAETQAVPSPAEDVFNGQSPTLAEYVRYRQTDEVPERFKKAENAASAPADAPKETAKSADQKSETAPASEPDTQELPKGSAAEKRIKQLLAEKKELQKKLEAAAKPTTPASSSAPAAPQNYKEWEQAFDPEKWIEEYAKANPKASYEKANAAMFSYMLGARDHFHSIEQRANAERQSLEAQLSEARGRYENFDEIQSNFLAKTISDKGAAMIPVQVLGIINDSEYLPDVLYTIGEDEAEMAKFIDLAKASPNKAIRYIAAVERAIAEELTATPRGEDGKFQAPEPKKTAAPKPPSPVGGPSSRAFDVSDTSLSPEEWARKRNAEIERRKRAG